MSTRPEDQSGNKYGREVVGRGIARVVQLYGLRYIYDVGYVQ